MQDSTQRSSKTSKKEVTRLDIATLMAVSEKCLDKEEAISEN